MSIFSAANGQARKKASELAGKQANKEDDFYRFCGWIQDFIFELTPTTGGADAVCHGITVHRGSFGAINYTASAFMKSTFIQGSISRDFYVRETWTPTTSG